MKTPGGTGGAVGTLAAANGAGCSSSPRTSDLLNPDYDPMAKAAWQTTTVTKPPSSGTLHIAAARCRAYVQSRATTSTGTSTASSAQTIANRILLYQWFTGSVAPLTSQKYIFLYVKEGEVCNSRSILVGTTNVFMQQSLVHDVQAACCLKMSLTSALLQRSLHDRRSTHSRLIANHINVPLPRSRRGMMQ